jgi:hypothetical protein
VAAVLVLPGCAARVVNTTPSARPDSLQSLISDRLYFGRNIPGGGVVTDADWERFLSEIVTPRFPAGLSVWRAQGQWRNANAVIEKEESFILDLLHPDDVTSETSVREIMTDYKTRFKQEAVLRVRDSVRVQFW